MKISTMLYEKSCVDEASFSLALQIARENVLTELRESIQTIDFYGWNEQTQSMIKRKVQEHTNKFIK